MIFRSPLASAINLRTSPTPVRRAQGAIRLQQAIVHKAFEICSDRDMQKYGSFTACRIVAGRESEVCSQHFTFHLTEA